jgi:hypothetical protein
MDNHFILVVIPSTPVRRMEVHSRRESMIATPGCMFRRIVLVTASPGISKHSDHDPVGAND